MRTTTGWILLATLLSVAGCQDLARTESAVRTPDSVAYIRAAEFNTLVARDDHVLLVEFCVPAGCFRCDQMREQIDRLASDEGERLTIRRVNLNQQPSLAKQYGVTVCPSYVAFRGGEEVFRAAFPTSAGLIAAGIDDYLLGSTANQAPASSEE